MFRIGSFQERLLEPLEPIKDFSLFRVRFGGLALAFGHPIFYWIWSVVYAQPYESLVWRSVACLAGLVAVAMSFKRDLQDRLMEISYSLAVYLGTVQVGVWFYVANGANATWLASCCVLTLLYFTLTDWRIAVVGTLLAAVVTMGLLPLFEPELWQQLPAENFVGPPLMVMGFTVFTAFFTHYASNNVRMLQLQHQMRALGIAAHEVRTPLAAIHLASGALSARLDDVKAGRPVRSHVLDELKDLSSEIEKATTSAQSIITIHLANANPNSPFSHRHPISVNQVAAAAVSQFSRSDLSRDGLVTVHPDGDFHILGDEIILQRVIQNLLENAFNAVMKRHRHVAPGCVTLTLRSQANVGILAVQDTGIGIARREIAKIFKPFHTTSEGQGHGLGLTFVQSVVRAYRGSIKVESEVGTGTVFTLTFPKIPITP